jgi:hypothetical protein
MKRLAALLLAFAAGCGSSGGGTSAPARVLYRCECGKTERVDAGYAAPTCACGKEMRR